MAFNGLFPVQSLRTGDRKITSIKESIPGRIWDQLSSVGFPFRVYRVLAKHAKL